MEMYSVCQVRSHKSNMQRETILIEEYKSQKSVRKQLNSRRQTKDPSPHRTRVTASSHKASSAGLVGPQAHEAMVDSSGTFGLNKKPEPQTATDFIK